MGETEVEGVDKIQWSPVVKSLFSSSSKQGKVNLYTYHDSQNHMIPQKYQPGEIIYPAWLERKAGICFGFDGKLLSFGNPGKPFTLNVQRVLQSPELAKAVKSFEDLLEHNKFPNACLKKV